MIPPPARTAALALALAAAASIAAPALVAAQPLQLPAAEVVHGPPLAVPAVPSFELPPGEPGFRNVRELRVRGQRDWLGTEITVKGYITWIYDCVKAVAKPGESPAKTQQRIDDDQTLCERPKFYLGATKDASPERSIWVVDVPRPPTKREQRVFKPEVIANWPAVPKFALGDYVAVTGTWNLSSPHGDRNSDGLLIFKSLQPATPSPAAAAPPAAAPKPRAQPAPPVVPPAPPPSRIDPAKQQESIHRMNAGSTAIGLGDFDVAIREYQAAVATWPDNHPAWYYLAYALSRKQDWAAATTAAAHATQLAPDAAMYHLMHGLVLYEGAVQQARTAQAAAQGRTPEEIVPDLRAVNQDAALAQLALAVHLNDALWRAHYYRGRICRDRGNDGMAAELFTKAVRSGPAQEGPYVALAELYRRWDYFDQAIEVARLGADHVTAPDEKGRVLYVLGMALDDKHEDAAAVASYTKALEANPLLAPALFQRGQLYVRMKKPAAAKADLEAYLANRAATPFGKAQASKMLMDLAAKKP